MDERKNLKPELKEIYERVMNTPASPPQPPASKTQLSPPPAPTTSAPHSPAPLPQAQATTLAQQVKNESTPPTSGAHYAPRTQGFVYTSRGSQPQPTEPPAKNSPEKHTNEKAHSTQKSTGNHAPVNAKMVALALIFICIWTLFWLLFFEILQPATFGL